MMKPTLRYTNSGKGVTNISVKFQVDETVILAAIHSIHHRSYPNNDFKLEPEVVIADYYLKDGTACRKGVEKLIRHKLQAEGWLFVDKFRDEHLDEYETYDEATIDESDKVFWAEVISRAAEWFPEWFESNTANYLRRLK